MTTTIQPRELRNRLDAGERYQIIDVRSAQEYAEGHIPCAVNLPMEEVESRLDDMHRHDPVILVCQSGNRARLTGDLLKPHRNDLILLEGGTHGWKEAGLPVVETLSSRLPMMRQVQLIAGPLILLGVALANTVDIRWSFVSAFVGAGLTLAGATGWCGMAILLSKMPWNRAKSATGGISIEKSTSCCN